MGCSSFIDNEEIRMLKCPICRLERCKEIEGGCIMDMMGRVGLVEIPILIAPDQKVWMDRMIKEGKIAIPPGGTLEKGSLYSMFVRMLLHNAMEEQKRQEVLDAEDEDDE
jgi:hypothetical protein